MAMILMSCPNCNTTLEITISHRGKTISDADKTYRPEDKYKFGVKKIDKRHGVNLIADLVARAFDCPKLELAFRDIRRKCGWDATNTTIHAAMNRLVALGFIEKCGDGKYSRYKKTPMFYHLCDMYHSLQESDGG